MQTILGSGGVVGNELAKSLAEYTDKIRLVSRNPEKINEGDELMSADLLDTTSVDKAVEGSRIVYVTIGFKYQLNVWRASWPVLINNVIDACMKHDAKLVFFDNIYMYDKDYLDGMTEETPINPPSKKGLVRADVYKKIITKIQEQKLTALIARAADFYGPGTHGVSMMTETIIKPLSNGKRANLMGSAKRVHSYTYTPDAGKATALLGNTEDAYNQVWHLPTSSEQVTGEQFVNKIAAELGVSPKFTVVSKAMLKFIGIFSPIMREMPEMLYQYQNDYRFDSSKFEKRFNMEPISYDQGIKNVLESDFS